ncbi:hypothetical protein RIVM261_013070 [Rivularia sp. IAM M-261]|nr:hypothetical protein RIVM261_013070 [Rivularia sp. IAM M-261]
MGVVDDKQEGQAKVRKKRKDGKLNSVSGSVGDVPLTSSKTGDDQVGVCGDDSERRITYVANPGAANIGKLLDQLIEETQKQLAGCEQQAEVLRLRLDELKKLKDGN